MPFSRPIARTAATATRSTSASASPKSVEGYRCASATPKPAPSGRMRSDAVRSRTSPSRATRSVLTSRPSWYRSTIASSVGDAAIVSTSCAASSSAERTRKIPRCPAESAGFSTAGKPTARAAALTSGKCRTPANCGCGTPRSANTRRMAILFVARCAVSEPMPGRPSRSATAATTGTARSAATVITPSTECARPTAATASTSVKSTVSPVSASVSPGASALPSTATTRTPSSCTRPIARRWCRPAPTKRTVLVPRTAGRLYLRVLRRGASPWRTSRTARRSFPPTVSGCSSARSTAPAPGPPSP